VRLERLEEEGCADGHDSGRARDEQEPLPPRDERDRDEHTERHGPQRVREPRSGRVQPTEPPDHLAEPVQRLTERGP
jgi:hypothetical protein